jgi:threonine/homoserine/homoserine lactone efflux protein
MIAGVHDLPLFIAAGLLLNVTPGADLALIGARSAAQGFRSGAAAALGVGAGCFVHVAAAALGLSALIASSATAFTVLRWVGAAYLVWLGIGLLRSSGGAVATETPTPPLTAWRSFVQGFLTNALNPKVALFFLAFLPQFIDANASHKALAFVALGTLFAFNGTIVNVAFAALVARMRRAFGGQRSSARWGSRGVGAFFVALGVRLAFFEGRGS